MKYLLAICVVAISLTALAPAAEARCRGGSCGERFPIWSIARNVRIERFHARRQGWNVPRYNLGARFGGRISGPVFFRVARFAP